ncbi:WD-repeat protein [Calothrix sp. NIES-4071]|nr:WD-repeat protein [Calothrix sp. NIES-4071]BAZ60932.1 WD-repeat protein [Calothrix sp. NIES-4105]
MNNQENIGAIPCGWQLERTLLGHNGLISRVEWAPNGTLLASPSFDRTIKLWHVDTGECIHTLKGHSGRVWAVAWSPDSKFIASGSIDNTVRLWQTDTGELIHTFDTPSGSCFNMAWSPDGELIAAGGIGDNWSIIIGHFKTQKSQILEGHTGQVNSVGWAPDGKTLASVSHDTTIRLWDRETLELKRILTGHSADVHSVNWAPDGKMLATASLDNTIRLWNPQTGQTIFVLEGHTASVNCVEFSYDGKFLASKSSDGTVRLWRCDTWEIVTILPEETFRYLPFGLSFHPKEPRLATLGEADIAVRVWKLDSEALLSQSPANPSDLYRNAKVVLVGESGVGKSGLSLVLTSKEFRATESTHGRYVWTFDKKELIESDNRKELREILLWDLAGQPGYRLIHQLYLNELAVALIVCDARSETDPFAGVYYWNRALRQAEKLQGDSAPSLKKFLVTARADRGSVSVSKVRIEALVKELGFDGHFETSAKEGWNIKELAQAICQAVDWEHLPKVISTELFQRIKVFLIQEKKAQRLLSPVDDLYRSFVQTSDENNSIQAREEFETCIRLVESRDLIRRLSFGNLILLQPELLDAYASAIINAAKDEPEGLGYIAEEDVLVGRFRMPKDERIPDKQQEKLLLIATVEELFAREIALRVQTDTGPLLVFPSQMTREWPEAPDPEGKAIIFEFEGAVVSIYTTLTVRLSRSTFFKCQELWKNAAIFEAQVGGNCGIWLKHIGNIDEGKAELTLFFKPQASEQTRLQFEEYVHTHLKRRALPETIKYRRIFVCTECDTPVNELYVTRRRERGFDWINCSVCDNTVSLIDITDRSKVASTEIPQLIPQMDKAADKMREIETATSIIKGKEATNDFDVFLSHNSKDKPFVEEIANHLRQRGLNPWLDKEEIPPGKSFQDYIMDGITQSKSAAFFIGLNGLGDWQQEELRILNNRRVKKHVSLIPVLLPGITYIPDQPSILLFLSELNWVRFSEDVNESEPLEQLIEGIKGLHKE